MVLKIDYQWFGQRELELDYCQKINLSKRLPQKLPKFSTCTLRKESLELELMLMLLYGIQIIKRLFHHLLITIKLISTFLKDSKFMVRPIILFPMEIWFGMEKTFQTNKKANMWPDLLLDMFTQDTKL
jgi:hypothetical protein